MSEKDFRDKVIGGYKKSPELLSRVIARVLVWDVGKENHLECLNQMITDINLITGDNVMGLCDDFARLILDAASNNKNS